MAEIPLVLNIQADPGSIEKLKKDLKIKVNFERKEAGGTDISRNISGMSTVIKGMYKEIIGFLGIGISIVSILSTIQKGIENMRQKMANINPALAKQQEIMKKEMELALMPMSRVMTMLMQPYLKIMMLQIRKQMIEAKPLLKEFGTATPKRRTEIIDTLLDMFRDTAGTLSALKQIFEIQTAEIAGTMGGYQQGLDLVMNSWLEGFKEWIGNFFQATQTKTANWDKATNLIEEAYNREIVMRNEAGGIYETMSEELITMKNIAVNNFGKATNSLVNAIQNAADRINALMPGGVVMTPVGGVSTAFPERYKAPMKPTLTGVQINQDLNISMTGASPSDVARAADETNRRTIEYLKARGVI